MANLRFLVTRTKAQALVETTHETPTNPGEADINSLCLCTDKKCFVWRGNVIGITKNDIISTILTNIKPIVNTSNALALSSIASSYHVFNSSHFRTLRAINTYETSLKLGAGLDTNMYGIAVKTGIGLSIGTSNEVKVNIGSGIGIGQYNDITIVPQDFVSQGLTVDSFNKIQLNLSNGLKFSSNAVMLDIGIGLKFSSNALSVNLGTGLTDNIDDQICVYYGAGITEGENHEIIARIGKGLQFDFDGKIVPNLGSGLDFNSDNKIVLNLGSGLRLNSNNKIVLNLATGLELYGNDIVVKTSDIHGGGLKTDTNGKLTINTLSTSILYVDDYDKTLAIRTGIGFSVDDYNRLRLTTEVKFDYNSTTGELNIITEQN